ncbi:MAG: hypothetical protein ABWZ02_09905 [Nakamurella sp.]
MISLIRRHRPGGTVRTIVCRQRIGLTLQVSGVGGKLTGWLARGGLDPHALSASKAFGMLDGDTAQMVDTV